MLTLDTTTRSLEMKLGGSVSTNQVTCIASYVDKSTLYTPGTQRSLSNNTSAVTFLSAPGASTQRQLKFANFNNRDTTSVNLTLQWNDNGVITEIITFTLATGEILTFTDTDAYNVYSVSGQKKTNVTVGAALPAGTNLIGYVGHGKTIKTVTGSLTADTDVITAVTSKRLKVIAYSLTSSGTSANVVIFKSNGTGGTALWQLLLQSSSSISAGANLAVSAPSWIFATAAGEKLTMDVSQTDTIYYGITYFDDDAT